MQRTGSGENSFQAIRREGLRYKLVGDFQSPHDRLLVRGPRESDADGLRIPDLDVGEELNPTRPDKMDIGEDDVVR